MTATAILILTIAVGLVPLIERDLRIAHQRIEARRRRAAMTPLQRMVVDLADASGIAIHDAVAKLQAALSRPVKRPLQRRWPR